MCEAVESPQYTGPAETRADLAHDGQLPWAVGASSYQVVRSVPSNPSATDGTNASFRHHHFLAWWGGRFWVYHIAAAPNVESSKRGRLNWSTDGMTWANADSAEIFPVATHQRAAFHVAANNVLLVTTWYNQNGEKTGRGDVGSRLVRRINGPGDFGPIHVLKHNHKGAATIPGGNPPLYSASSDAAFKTACDELLNSKLYRQQLQEEDQDPAFYVVNGALGSPMARAFNWYTRNNGEIVGLWKYADTVATAWDFGQVPAPQDYTSRLKLCTSSKIWGCKTTDGRFALFGNPYFLRNDTGTWEYQVRYPLAVSASADGITFDTPYATVEGDMDPMRYPDASYELFGDTKAVGHQYVRGIEEGFPRPADGNVWLVTSHNKEDIWVTRVPVPIITRVTGPVHDDFQSVSPGGAVPQWNLRSEQWATVKVAQEGDNRFLRLTDKADVGYAKAFRVFEAVAASGGNTFANLSFRLRPHQANSGRLEVDVMDRKGQRPVRLAFDATGAVRANSGETMSQVASYTAAQWLDVAIRVDMSTGTYSLWLGGTQVGGSRTLAASTGSVERLEFRTGVYRLNDYTRRRAVPITTTIAGADTMVAEVVFDVDDVAASSGTATSPTYTVSYDDNGATSGTAPANQTKTHDVALTLASNSGNLAKTGYTFAGWNTAANGTGTDYAAGGSYTANAAATLFAKWAAVPPAGSGVATETFDTSATAAAHGWTGSGNTANGNNFGWSNTGNVLGTAGEAGGIFARSTDYGYYADTSGISLSRTSTMNMSGSFRLGNDNFDGLVYLGYFDPAGLVSGQAPSNFVGMSIAEPSVNAGDPFRGNATVAGTGMTGTGGNGGPTNVVIASEPGKYCGWPAIYGAWRWDGGREILVGFAQGEYVEQPSHNYGEPSVSRLARSADGGHSWTIEDPQNFDKGSPVPSPGNIDFDAPGFAMRVAGSQFYVSYDRGKNWEGPYLCNGLMEDANLVGKENTSRNAYLVTGPQSCLLFMSARVPGQWDKTFVAETTDGGATFQFVSWVVPLQDPYRAVMPAVARLADGTLVVTIRRREDDLSKTCWVDCYRSTDNGRTWSFLSRVGETGTTNGNPPGLTAFEDGRLVCVYGDRSRQKMFARVSADGGQSWAAEVALREGFQPSADEPTFIDFGYPTVVVNHENRIVTMYYWATQNLPQQHIAGTIWTVPQGIINLPQNTTLTYNLTWTGGADGSGTLSGTLAGQAVSVAVGAGTGNFTAFGLLCGGMISGNPAQTGQFYFDNLTYTKGGATPTLLNHSFEADKGGDPAGSTSATPTGWTLAGTTSVKGTQWGYTDRPAAPDGDCYAYLWLPQNGANLSQTLGDTVVADKTYTVSGALLATGAQGWGGDNTPIGLSMSLVNAADHNEVFATTGIVTNFFAKDTDPPNPYWWSGAAFASYSASFTATGAQAGKTLAVVLKKETGGLGQAQFDNIAVDSVPAATAYEVWRGAYFTPAELADPAISGADADPDGDGFANWKEYAAGTDPTDAKSLLALTGLVADGGVPGGVAVRWLSVEGKRYSLLSTTNLALGFNALQVGIPATPPTNVYADAVTPSRQRFYRVQVEE